MKKVGVTKYYKDLKHQRSCDMQTLLVEAVISEVTKACVGLVIAAFVNWRSKVAIDGKEEAQ